MPFKLVGLAEFESALKASVRAADAGSRAAVVNASRVLENATKAKLTTSSHRKGTPTPSRPGQPPSLVSGTLRRSVRSSPAEKIGPTMWQTTVGPTVIYARIHEKGGQAGWGHTVTLPARPYFEPTVNELLASGALFAAFRAGWERI